MTGAEAVCCHVHDSWHQSLHQHTSLDYWQLQAEFLWIYSHLLLVDWLVGQLSHCFIVLLLPLIIQSKVLNYKWVSTLVVDLGSCTFFIFPTVLSLSNFHTIIDMSEDLLRYKMHTYLLLCWVVFFASTKTLTSWIFCSNIFTFLNLSVYFMNNEIEMTITKNFPVLSLYSKRAYYINTNG